MEQHVFGGRYRGYSSTALSMEWSLWSMKMSNMKMHTIMKQFSEHCDSVDCAGNAGSRRERGKADGSAKRLTHHTHTECWTTPEKLTLIYTANRVSSERPAFLFAFTAAPAVAERSSLGGVGSVGTISAALALSSKNLSNSGRKYVKVKKKQH